MIPPLAAPPLAVAKPVSPPSDDYRAAAQALEGQFIAEMLRHAGFDEALAGSQSGLGGESFSSLLVDQYAERIAAAGGFGLAERIAASLESQAGRAR